MAASAKLKQSWSKPSIMLAEPDTMDQLDSPRAEASAPEPSPMTPGSKKELGLEPSIHLLNFRAKVNALSKKSSSQRNFADMSDLVEEAKVNRAALMNEEQAASELARLLAMPPGARRAVTLRDLTEFGRHVQLPDVFGSERRATYMWYHALQRLRLVEFDAGAEVLRGGAVGEYTLWIIQGTVESRSPEQMAAMAASPSPCVVTIDGPNPSGTARAPSPTRSGASSPTPGGPSRSVSRRTTASGFAAQPAARGSVTTVSVSDAAGLPGLPGSRSIGRGNAAGGGAGARGGGGNAGGTSMHANRSLAKVASMKSFALKSMKAREVAAARQGQSSPGTGAPVFGRWSCVGEEAMQGVPYPSSFVVGASGLVCAALHRSDYDALLQAMSRESFEGLRLQHLLLMPRGQRQQKDMQELSSLMAVTELFRTMPDDSRVQVCSLLEYMAVPEGAVLFEEGDKVDFCYVVLSGQVSFTRYNDAKHMAEEVLTKGPGEHFGTLATLSDPNKRRPFGARATQAAQFALISRVAYNRVVKRQLEAAIAGRMELLRSLSVLRDQNVHFLQRLAMNCQDEDFAPGVTVLDPSTPVDKLFLIGEGDCKLLWVSEAAGQYPPAVDPPFDRAAQLRITGAASAQGMAGGAATGGAIGDRSASSLGMAYMGLDANTSNQMGLSTVTGAGSGAAAGLKARRGRGQTVEVAVLTRGDMLNGPMLHGRVSCFTVVARGPLKLVSLEVPGLEVLLGKDVVGSLRELALSQQVAYRERTNKMVETRMNAGMLLDKNQPGMGASTGRQGGGEGGQRAAGAAGAGQQGTPMHHGFLQHYIPNLPSGTGNGASSSGDHRGGSYGSSGTAQLAHAAGVPLGLGALGGSAAASGDVVGRLLMELKQVGGPSGRDGIKGGGKRPQALPPPMLGLAELGSFVSPGSFTGGGFGAGSGPSMTMATVLAQNEPVRRTTLRSPSPLMAAALGIHVEGDEEGEGQPGHESSDTSLGSGAQPHAAVGKDKARVTKDGKRMPRAGKDGRKRELAGLPFAGTVALSVLDAEASLLRLVPSQASPMSLPLATISADPSSSFSMGLASPYFASSVPNLQTCGRSGGAPDGYAGQGQRQYGGYGVGMSHHHPGAYVHGQASEGAMGAGHTVASIEPVASAPALSTTATASSSSVAAAAGGAGLSRFGNQQQLQQRSAAVTAAAEDVAADPMSALPPENESTIQHFPTGPMPEGENEGDEDNAAAQLDEPTSPYPQRPVAAAEAAPGGGQAATDAGAGAEAPGGDAAVEASAESGTEGQRAALSSSGRGQTLSLRARIAGADGASGVGVGGRSGGPRASMQRGASLEEPGSWPSTARTTPWTENADGSGAGVGMGMGVVAGSRGSRDGDGGGITTSAAGHKFLDTTHSFGREIVVPEPEPEPEPEERQQQQEEEGGAEEEEQQQQQQQQLEEQQQQEEDDTSGPDGEAAGPSTDRTNRPTTSEAAAAAAAAAGMLHSVSTYGAQPAADPNSPSALPNAAVLSKQASQAGGLLAKAGGMYPTAPATGALLAAVKPGMMTNAPTTAASSATGSSVAAAAAAAGPPGMVVVTAAHPGRGSYAGGGAQGPRGGPQYASGRLEPITASAASFIGPQGGLMLPFGHAAMVPHKQGTHAHAAQLQGMQSIAGVASQTVSTFGPAGTTIGPNAATGGSSGMAVGAPGSPNRLGPVHSGMSIGGGGGMGGARATGGQLGRLGGGGGGGAGASGPAPPPVPIVLTPAMSDKLLVKATISSETSAYSVNRNSTLVSTNDADMASAGLAADPSVTTLVNGVRGSAVIILPQSLNIYESVLPDATQFKPARSPRSGEGERGSPGRHSSPPQGWGRQQQQGAWLPANRHNTLSGPFVASPSASFSAGSPSGGGASSTTPHLPAAPGASPGRGGGGGSPGSAISPHPASPGAPSPDPRLPAVPGARASVTTVYASGTAPPSNSASPIPPEVAAATAAAAAAAAAAALATVVPPGGGVLNLRGGGAMSPDGGPVGGIELLRKTVKVLTVGARMAGEKGLEPMLPLEVDGGAPPLQDRKLSSPSLDDINYILNRWANRWSDERDDVRRRKSVDNAHLHHQAGSSRGPSSARAGPASSINTPRTSNATEGGMTPRSQAMARSLGLPQIGAVAGVGPNLDKLEQYGLPYRGGTPRRT